MTGRAVHVVPAGSGGVVAPWVRGFTEGARGGESFSASVVGQSNFIGTAELPRELPDPSYTLPGATVEIGPGPGADYADWGEFEADGVARPVTTLWQPGEHIQTSNQGLVVSASSTSGGSGILAFRSRDTTSMPADGVRLTPYQEDWPAEMAVIRGYGNVNGAAFKVSPGCDDVAVRYMGFALSPSHSALNAVMSLGSGGLTTHPQRIWLDQVGISGNGYTAGPYIVRGLFIDADYVVIKNSALTRFHNNGSDSNGIAIDQGGPGLLLNSHVEGFSERIIVGGTTYAGDDARLPHDWMYVGTLFTIERDAWDNPITKNSKNTIEWKRGRRFTVQHCISEIQDAHDQSGHQLHVKTANQGTNNPVVVTEDVSFRRIIVREGQSLITFAGVNGQDGLQCRRIALQDVLAYRMGEHWTTVPTGATTQFQERQQIHLMNGVDINNQPAIGDIFIDGVTNICGEHDLGIFIGSSAIAVDGLTLRNYVFGTSGGSNQNQSIFRNGGAVGQAAFAGWTNLDIRGLMLPDPRPAGENHDSAWGSLTAASEAALFWEDYANEVFRPTPSSPMWNTGVAGRQHRCADYDACVQHMTDIENGTYSWNGQVLA